MGESPRGEDETYRGGRGAKDWGEEYRFMWQSPRERSEGKIYALVFMMVSSLCFIQ